MFNNKRVSYARIIKNIIQTSKDKRMTLQEIYSAVISKYPEVCRKKGWRNSIRHNLSIKHSLFYKIPRDGKGNYWAVKTDDHDFCLEEIKVTEIMNDSKEILFTGNLDSIDEEFDYKFTNYGFRFNK
ncbi:Forkhead box protein L2 [Dictyocoela muelleri]|nr:Forkhead box protein L2 [Dictyocoela muelleri]